MTEEISSGKYYIDVILKSKGVEALNRLHSRSFSVNIVTMNAKQLSEVIDFTTNPEMMLPVFNVENEGASKQVHREANRFVHNYVCSVSTFADHSRNFMRRYYKNTQFHRDYDDAVEKVFSMPQCRFVRDLRNYITHRGLPDSNMNLTMTNDQNGEGTGSIDTEIYYGTEAFKDWEKWSSGSKKLLDQSGEKLSLKEIFVPHFVVMEKFNEWFENRFREHHSAELAELEEMHKIMERLESAEKIE